MSLRKIKGEHRIKNTFGICDVYKVMTKNKWKEIGEKINSKDFHKIISSVNKCIANHFINGETIILPYNIGKLEVVKTKTYIEFKDNKIKTNKIIDWRKTLDLWNEDEESKRNKVLIRYDLDYQIHCRYNKYYAIYKNRTYYCFNFTRNIRNKVFINYITHKIDGIIVN